MNTLAVLWVSSATGGYSFLLWIAKYSIIQLPGALRLFCAMIIAATIFGIREFLVAEAEKKMGFTVNAALRVYEDKTGIYLRENRVLKK